VIKEFILMRKIPVLFVKRKQSFKPFCFGGNDLN